MKGLPPEIDRLMWAIAESRNDHAMEEFFQRHPSYRAEMIRRASMVSALRGERPHSEPSAVDIPRFSPRGTPPKTSPFVGVGVGVLAFTAIACAAYAAWTFANSRPTVMRLSVPEPVPQEPRVVYRQPSPPTSLPTTPKPSAPAPHTPEAPVAQVLPNVTITRTNLVSAIQLVASSGNLDVEIGPGFVDQEVSVEYHDRTALQILQDMGKQYAFTVFDEGGGRLLVIPAIDPGGQTPDRRVGA